MKSALSPEQCTDFQVTLKGFKGGDISFETVLEVAASLFGEGTELFRAFGAFVPPSHRRVFNDRLHWGVSASFTRPSGDADPGGKAGGNDERSKGPGAAGR